MGYSSHGDPGQLTTRGPHPSAGARADTTWRTVSIVTVVFVWALFGITAASNPATLNDIWLWVGDLPMAGQIVAWILGLPWMVGIGIYQSGLSDGVRLLLIAGVAVLSIGTFVRDR